MLSVPPEGLQDAVEIANTQSNSYYADLTQWVATEKHALKLSCPTGALQNQSRPSSPSR